MAIITNKINIALKRHGLIGLIVEAAKYLWHYIINMQPQVRKQLHERQQRCETFDKQFGVKTSGYIHHTELNVKNNVNQSHAASYFGSDPKYFRDVIASLKINYRDFVFIDFGSGMGRVILLATEFPFKRIVGVEFSEELDKIAKENILKFNCEVDKERIEAVCLDAVNYILPIDCLVCYFFNPFDATIMSKVLSNIEKSILANFRDVIIVYANPVVGHMFDNSVCFTSLATMGPVRIWRSWHNI